MPNSLQNDNPLDAAMRAGSPPQRAAFNRLMCTSHGNSNEDEDDDSESELHLTTTYDDEPSNGHARGTQDMNPRQHMAY